MILGYVYANQLDSHDANAMLYRKITNYKDGIFTGMNLSHTDDTITVSDGLILIAGRPTAIAENEQIVVEKENAYCKLILEQDLTKDATEETFEQVQLKIIKNASSYPSLTQQDMDNGGTLYQVELAQFRTTNTGILDFTDTRTFLDLESIWNQIDSKTQALIDELKQDIADVKDGSAYVLKDNIVNEVYPIGSIYMSVNATNPENLFGGTWEAWGTGRIPIGVDTSQTEFDTVEKTGGQKTLMRHTHTQASHSHGTGSSIHDTFLRSSGDVLVNEDGRYLPNEGGTSNILFANARDKVTITETKNTGTATPSINYAGDGNNNMNPYITCYMWKRIV